MKYGAKDLVMTKIAEMSDRIYEWEVWDSLVITCFGDFAELIPDRIPGWELCDENNPEHMKIRVKENENTIKKITL
jgi:hypothetical protein